VPTVIMLRKFALVTTVVVVSLGTGYFLGTMSGGVKSGPKAVSGGGPGGNPASSSASWRDLNPTAPIPVVAASVERKDVPVYRSGIGTVIAFNTVQVKAREDGQITEIRFREGQDVKAGDVLAVIDQRPYTAALKQAQANLAKDESQLANARLDLTRAVNLKEFATKQSVDTQKALVAQFEAMIGADQAQIEAAKTNLDYTVIASPIDGRTGIRNIDAGNIVHAADTTAIVTVTQMQPIAVVFTLPSDDLPAVQKGQAKGSLEVAALAKDNQTVLAKGELTLVDNQIDPTTGTVKLKATFANADRALWPGQFVNGRVRIDVQHDGLTVPATGVQRGPDGTYVWVIEGDSKVAMRPVTVVQTQDGQALVGQGLKFGEQVVVDGQYKLQAGSKVEKIAQPGSGPA
jgi:multidrug efflux system membrane fusion protein